MDIGGKHYVFDEDHYVIDGWEIFKTFPGGPGMAIRRFLFAWRWRAWPHENAGRPDYFRKRGWAWSRMRALSDAAHAANGR